MQAANRIHFDDPDYRFRVMRRQQRFDFVGAWLYSPTAKSFPVLCHILSKCLTHRLRRTATQADIDAVLKGNGYLVAQRMQMWRSDWRITPQYGNGVFDELKAVGYGGDIDQLWLSVFGRFKPSTPTAHIRRDPATGRPVAPPVGFRRGFVLWTGQTRKPGSRRS